MFEEYSDEAIEIPLKVYFGLGDGYAKAREILGLTSIGEKKPLFLGNTKTVSLMFGITGINEEVDFAYLEQLRQRFKNIRPERVIVKLIYLTDVRASSYQVIREVPLTEFKLSKYSQDIFDNEDSLSFPMNMVGEFTRVSRLGTFNWEERVETSLTGTEDEEPLSDISEEISAIDELLETVKEVDISKTVEESLNDNEYFIRLTEEKKKIIINTTSSLIKELETV